MAKTVLITGCSSGIGADLVRSFRKRGLTVFASARKTASLSSFSNDKDIHLLALDVTSENSVREAYEQVKVKTGGKLDYLVNNAGIGQFLPALDHPLDEARKIFETNFWGVLRMIQVFSPLIIDAKGTIVNISSGLGSAHGPYSSIYNSSKAALDMLGETLRLEVAPFDVKVLTVVTGAISTSFLDKTADVRLPPDSRYHAVEKQLEAIAKGDDGWKRTPSNQFAEEVVGDILGGMTGKTYRGSQAALVKYAIPFLPTWIIDRILLKGSGLLEMKASMRTHN